MSNILEQLRLWIEQMILMLGYVGIAVFMFLENIFPPIPSEIIMPFAGFLVAEGKLDFTYVLIAGTTGALLGAVAIYYVGVWIEDSRMRLWFAQYGHLFLLSVRDFDRALAAFDRNGKKMVFLGRLIPTIRSLISLPAGLDQMNLGKFLLFTAFGTTVWNIVLAYGGLVLGQNWRRILDFINSYELVLWIIFALLALLFVIRRIRR